MLKMYVQKGSQKMKPIRNKKKILRNISGHRSLIRSTGGNNTQTAVI